MFVILTQTDLLVDLSRRFDFGVILEDEFSKLKSSLKSEDVISLTSFLRQFEILIFNLDFLVEYRRIFNLNGRLIQVKFLK